MDADLPPTVRRHYPLARPMFWIAALDLFIIAGVIHRAVSQQVTDLEVSIILLGHFILWPLIALETWVAFFIRDRVMRPALPTLVRTLFITIAPPMRMGMPCPFTGQLWIPIWGWCERGKPLEDRLDRAFHKPMLLFALLILPVLAFQLIRADEVKESPTLALGLDIAIAVIWVAFATEFVIKVSAVRKPFIYSKERWLDLAIVLLPMFEFILTTWAEAGPLARLMRLTRAVAPEQLAKMGQMYRLRGLMMKGWRAFLVLKVVAKLTGNTLQKQLRSLEIRIAEQELTLNELKAQADVVREKLAEQNAADLKEERDLDPKVQIAQEQAG